MTGFDDSVMICPFFHTHHRPPHPVVHTTGSPSQKSAGLRGAQSGTGSPTAAHGGLGGGADRRSRTGAEENARSETARDRERAAGWSGEGHVQSQTVGSFGG